MRRSLILAAWWLLAATSSLLVAAGRHHSHEHAAASRDLLRHLRETQGRNQSSDLPESASRGPRLVACTLVKNELPYVVEWIEFHRLQGFSRIVIYDDSSDDNIALLETVYRYVLAQADFHQNQGMSYLVRDTCALVPALAWKGCRLLNLVFSPGQAWANFPSSQDGCHACLSRSSQSCLQGAELCKEAPTKVVTFSLESASTGSQSTS